MKERPDLTNLLNRWHRRILPTGWDRVRIDWEDRLPFNVRGRCFWEGGHQDAMILINPRAEWTADYPVERTIIHELLHLHFATAGDPCPEYIEEAVVSLTTTIWTLDGANREAERWLEEKK